MLQSQLCQSQQLGEGYKGSTGGDALPTQGMSYPPRGCFTHPVRRGEEGEGGGEGRGGERGGVHGISPLAR